MKRQMQSHVSGLIPCYVTDWALTCWVVALWKGTWGPVGHRLSMNQQGCTKNCTARRAQKVIIPFHSLNCIRNLVLGYFRRKYVDKLQWAQRRSAKTPRGWCTLLCEERLRNQACSAWRWSDIRGTWQHICKRDTAKMEPWAAPSKQGNSNWIGG